MSNWPVSSTGMTRRSLRYVRRRSARDDIRMVLHGRDDHFVIRGEHLCVSGGYQVDGFGRPLGEQDLLRKGRVDKVADFFPGFFHRVGGVLGQGVDATVDVGIDRGVVLFDRPDDRQGLLGSGPVVQVDEWRAAYLLVQQGKLPFDVLYVDRVFHEWLVCPEKNAMPVGHSKVSKKTRKGAYCPSRFEMIFFYGLMQPVYVGQPV